MGGQITAISSGEAFCQQFLDSMQPGRRIIVSLGKCASRQHTCLVHGAATAWLNAFRVVMYRKASLKSSMLNQHQHLYTLQTQADADVSMA